MGSKNLKAGVVRGTKGVTAPDAPGFATYIRGLIRDDVLTNDNLWANTDGLPTLVEASDSAGILPTRNFQEDTFEFCENLTADTLRDCRLGKKACFSCPLACGNYVRVGEAAVEDPEYETLGIAGSNCGISDLEAIVAFNAACDDLGLDTISVGGVTAFAMELTEKGIYDFGIRFGDTKGYLAVPGLIARREGSGIELARDVRFLSEKYGGLGFAMHVKGLETARLRTPGIMGDGVGLRHLRQGGLPHEGVARGG